MGISEGASQRPVRIGGRKQETEPSIWRRFLKTRQEARGPLPGLALLAVFGRESSGFGRWERVTSKHLDRRCDMLGQVWTHGWEIAIRSPSIKRRVVRQWYEFFATLDRDGMVRLMNYGYADGRPLRLLAQDEPERYGIQLYHRVASQIDLRELDVLEVGSGRGGGASYVMRYMRPRTYTGIDIAPRMIAFCQKWYRIPGLYFFEGNAENLHFPDATFDAVINIESSSHYGDIEKFFREVRHVLNPGGFFLYADILETSEIPELKEQFRRAGLTLLQAEDVAPHVVRALELDNERKLELMRRYVPRFLRSAVAEFVGTRGSEKYELFRSRELCYLCCLLKAEGPEAGLALPNSFEL